MAKIEKSPLLQQAGWFVRLLAVVLIGLSQAKAQTDHWLTGYYANYNEGVMSPSQVDYTKLTHIIYWPLIPNNDGTLNTSPFGAPFPSDAIDLVTRAHQAGIKALVGVGGDQASGASAGFTASTTPANLSTFVNNIVSLMQEYGFDGVDINWEAIGSGAGDNSQFPAFIAALRNKLNTISPRPLLTMAPETYTNGGRPDLIGPIYSDFDQLNIQTYQMSYNFCGWETWFNSPLNNGGATFSLVPSEALPSITNAIADYTTNHAHIPIGRLAMGIQFDAEVWTGGTGTSTGGVTQPKQTWTNDSNCNSNSGAPKMGTMPYRQMTTTLATNPAYVSNYDNVADQSWLSYDPSGAGTTNEANDRFVSYDSPQSIAQKGVDLSPAQAGVGGSLGGGFIFELSGDFLASQPQSQQHPLLTSAYAMQYLLPGQLSGLSATPGAGSVALTWTAAPFADSYNIYTETTASLTPTGTPKNVTATSTTISSLTPGTLYYFLVEPVDVFGAGAFVQTSATPTGTAAPAPPTGLTATAGVDSVSLTWNASANATSYILERSTGGGWTWTKTLTATSFVNTGLTAGTSYTYAVKASNSRGTSAISNEASATPGPGAPSALSATSVSATGGVTLSWKAPAGASAAYSYQVFEGAATGAEGATAVATVANNVTTVTLSGLPSNMTYYFTVATSVDGLLSASSNEAVSAPRILYVPDYTGEAVRVRIGGASSVTSIWFSLPSCNPNSLAVNRSKLYVVCNSDFGNRDAILVYDATKIRSAPGGRLTIKPFKTITSGDFDSLIGIAFDSSNDLWVASNANSEVLEFTAAQLATASPADIVSLVDSPSSPVALAFDTDQSLWITGLYGDGILLNFDPSQFGLQGAANPRYCAATDALGGICITQTNLFTQPEGVAVFKGSVWVANNSTTGSNGLGGATPGRELVNLAVSNGSLTVSGIYGSVVPDSGGTATSPFFCPGGLFASSSELWVNDESYGEANPQCGANGDTAGATGGIFNFGAAQLASRPVTKAPTFANITGRPGFGGIFVENDR